MDDSLDDLQRYLGNSPFRLGMISFERCGTGKQKRNDNAVEHKESKKVRSVPGKKKPHCLHLIIKRSCSTQYCSSHQLGLPCLSGVDDAEKQMYQRELSCISI